MIKKGFFKSMLFALTVLFASILFNISVNANDVTLDTAKLYGTYDFNSSELTTVIIELEEKSIVESKHAGKLQTKENLQYERNRVIEKLEKLINDANVKREYDFVFSGMSVELPENNILLLLQVQGIKAIYPNVTYTTTEVEDAIIEDVNPNMIESNPYVGAPEAWSMGYTGKGITVAVIDSGVDYTHPELSHAFGAYKGYDYIENDIDPQDERGHGTHVAGTIAAKSFGIAPDVRLIAYRVLDANGSGTTSQVLAGIEQAVIDGVDVMNLSLGNSLNDPDYATSIALDWAMAEGVVAVTSNGNNGPDNWTVGSPGASRKAISVGATQLPFNVYSVGLFTSNEVSYPTSKIIGADNEQELVSLDGFTYEYVYAGLGSAEEFENVDVNGKVALVKRGGYAFYEKAFNADAAGAVAIIIFNHLSGEIDFEYNGMPLPSFRLDLADGQKMLAELERGINTVTFSIDYVKTISETMGDFSSRGPAFSTWMIKPDISAPGVDIISTIPGGGYASYQGTSMASPHVAAAAALVLQAHPNYTTEEVKAALMNTAERLIDPYTGEQYPHNSQGAGSLRIAEAIKAETLVTPGSYSFGKFIKNTGKQVEGQKFEIKNFSNLTKEYTFEVEFYGNPEGIKVMTSNNTLVKANSTQLVNFNVQVDTTVLAAGYYEGAITISDGTEVIVVPTILFVQEPDYPRVAMANVIPYEPGYYLAYGYLPAGADYVDISFFTYNSSTGDLGYLGTPFYATNVEPGYYIEIWDGTVNGQLLPPGEYVVMVYAEYCGQYDYVLTLFEIK